MHTDRDHVRRQPAPNLRPTTLISLDCFPLLLRSKPLPPQIVGPLLIKQHPRMLTRNRISTQIVANNCDTLFPKMGSPTPSRFGQIEGPPVYWRLDKWFPTLTVASRLVLVVSA